MAMREDEFMEKVYDTVYKKLQENFPAPLDSGEEYAKTIKDQQKRMATVISEAISSLIPYIQQKAQATGTVTTAVTTTGTAAAQTGNGTGTTTIAPGGIT